MNHTMSQTDLEKIITDAQDAYYNGSPIMEDDQFDAYWDELVENFPDSELLKSVGSDESGFKKEKHIILMGSQDKVTDESGVEKFINKNNGSIQVSYKMDGISVELVYENSKLTKAITRGNGEIGDNIFSNVVKMNFVPKTVKGFTGSVRGEILLSKENKEKYFPEAKNCRNQASGVSKRLDGSGCEYLDVVVYDVRSESNFVTQTEMMEFLVKSKFKVAPYSLYKNPKASEIMSKLDEVFSEKNRSEYEYDIDGLVLKTDIVNYDDLSKNLRPKTQIALKPAKTVAITKIVDIDWSMKNGTMTPVIVVEPVNLLGSTVSRASMSNIAIMYEMQIDIGDTVEITKGGEIIPYILKNVTKNISR